MNPRFVTLSGRPARATPAASAGPGDRPARVLCVGLVASDFLAPVSFPIPRDVKVRLGALLRQGGGPAANAAVALARLGLRVAFAGAVGDDGTGSDQREALRREGVDVDRLVTVPDVPSFVSFILVDETDGSRTILSAPAERPRLGPGSVSFPEPPPDLLLVDGWGGPAQDELARAARAAGVPVLLDAGSCRPEVLDLLALADVVIGSRPFAEAFAGPGPPEPALEKLKNAGPRLVAITDGERGTLAAARGADGVFPVPAFKVNAVDTTGAGDAFHAGAAWALLEGCGWEESLRQGAAVAALKCLRAGARSGLPDRVAVARFLAG